MNITLKEAIAQTGKHEKTIRNWVKNGYVKAVKENGRWSICSNSLANYYSSSKSSKYKDSQLMTESDVAKIASLVVSEIKPILTDDKNDTIKSDAPSVNQLEQEKDLWKNRFIVLEAQFHTLLDHVKDLTDKLEVLEYKVETKEQQQQPQTKSEEIEESVEEAHSYVKQPAKNRPNEQSKPEKSKRQEVDEEKAQKWLRDNINSWIDEPCPFGKTGGRTWRQLAKNEGDKIYMSGKGKQSPRSYLHAIENWKDCKVWARLKAKMVLEIEGVSHYTHPIEMGGL